MLEEGSVDLFIGARPIRSGDVNSVLHVRTREGVDRNALGVELVLRHPNDLLFFRSYCNIPDLISLGTDHHSIYHLKGLLEELLEDGRVLSDVPNIIIDAWEFPTWKDRMLPRLEKQPDRK